jgi:hypothetical protein
MSLRKRIEPKSPFNKSTWNQTSPENPSHLVDENTDFALRPITYENLDQAVFNEFNKRFAIKGKDLPLIQLDTEVASTIFQNHEQINNYKKYINLPYFTVWRSKTSPMYRVSPSYKPVIYAVPKMKAQGLVYEEWITPPPQMQNLTYVFKFLTNYRSTTNEHEEQMMRYFKNKRNVILLDNERFEISPASSDTLGTLETIEREGVESQTLYVLTYELNLLCYIRKLEDIQKRERPNRIAMSFKEKGGPTIDVLEVKIDRQTETI